MQQRTTFNIIGPRPSVDMLDPQLVRARLSVLGFLDPSFILKSDETVVVSVDKNIYNVSSNLEFKVVKTVVNNQTIILPTDNFGIQQILVNIETDNEFPAFGEIEDYTVVNRMIDLGTLEYTNRSAYIKYLTVK